MGGTLNKLALVVDDSMVVRKMVSKALEGAGFEVLQAGNGKEALAIAAGKALSVVITDFNMPTMNGLELIKSMRAETEHKYTPIVFLTTEVEDRLRDEARASGATAWIQKPFQPDKVLSVVNKIAG